MGVLGAPVCARVYGIVRGSFDGAGRGTVLGDERGLRGIGREVVGNEVCVAEREGVKQDAMDVDSSSDEDEGEAEAEGGEMPDSSPCQKQIQIKNIGAHVPPRALASPAARARIEPARLSRDFIRMVEDARCVFFSSFRFPFAFSPTPPNSLQ